VRGLPITLTCDCGQVAYVRYGGRWTCPECGKTWDTARIPGDEYAQLAESVRRYRLLALGPPLVLAAVLLPLAVVVGIQFGLLFFVLVLVHGIFVIPKIRQRATQDMSQRARRWDLSPE
jgi:hypothetical protein